mmetsp:Transcript_5770/g.19022  ORF Transcript_5770/g.19022 Transcript_5770/m.19022 type:complete len:576 (-) Transcript_5770:69-1796(-)
MVRRLVHQQNVRVLEHGPREGELHAPAAGEGRHGVREHLLREADLEHDRGHVFPRRAARLDPRVVEDVVEAGVVAELAHDVGLDEDGLDLVRGREALELPVRDGPHQRRLAAVVAAEEAVLVAALELHLRVVEEDLRAVGQRELAVAELLRRVLLFFLLLDDHHRRRGVHGRGRGGLAAGEAPAHGLGGLGPLGAGEAAPRRQRVADVEHVGLGDGRVALGGADLGPEGLGDLGLDLGALGQAAALGLEALHELHRPLADLARLRVRHLVGQLHQTRQQLGQEGRGVAGVVDELRHVADDERRLALERRRARAALAERARQERHDDGERGRVDTLHEGRRGQGVDALGHLLGPHGGGDELGEHGLDVAVAAQTEARRHRGLGRGRDLLLRVPEAGRDLGHDAGEAGRDLLRGQGAERREALERRDARGPLLLDRHGLEEAGELEGRGLGGEHGHAGGQRGLGRGLDGALLRPARLEDGRVVGEDPRRELRVRDLAQEPEGGVVGGREGLGEGRGGLGRVALDLLGLGDDGGRRPGGLLVARRLLARRSGLRHIGFADAGGHGGGERWRGGRTAGA